MRHYVETSDEWIASRTGIRQRYFCGEGETATTLAIGAAQKALAASSLNPSEIGCVLAVSYTHLDVYKRQPQMSSALFWRK